MRRRKEDNFTAENKRLLAVVQQEMGVEQDADELRLFEQTIEEKVAAGEVPEAEGQAMIADRRETLAAAAQQQVAEQRSKETRLARRKKIRRGAVAVFAAAAIVTGVTELVTLSKPNGGSVRSPYVSSQQDQGNPNVPDTQTIKGMKVGQREYTEPLAAADIKGIGTVLDGEFGTLPKPTGDFDSLVIRTKDGYVFKTPGGIEHDPSIPWSGATQKNLIKIIRVVENWNGKK